MKNKFRLAQLSVIPFFACFILSIESCTKTGKCEEVPDLSNSGIQVDFKENATGKYLYTTSNPLYNIDSLKIYDENNVRLSILMHVRNIPNAPTGGYWSINFGNIYNPQTDAGAYNMRFAETLLLSMLTMKWTQ